MTPPPLGAEAGGDPEWWSTAMADNDPARPQAPAPARGPAAGSGPKLLAVLAWPALGVGLLLPDWQDRSLLGSVLSWSLFAVVCLVLVNLAVLVGGQGRGMRNSWQLGVFGAGGLAAFWVLLVLPGIASNAGFALSLATTSALAAMWLAPGRPR
jgi:hypothetical protein